MRLKSAASETADGHAALSVGEARAIVDSIIFSEHALDIPTEARNYFAGELEAMTRNVRR